MNLFSFFILLKYRILACDWKALTILKGINSANSQFFCLWCYCQKSQICDFSIPSWDIKRSSKDQAHELRNGSRRGYIKSDLLPFIDYKNIVPDDLHLRIRISLKLFNQIVTWAIDQKNEERLEVEMKRIGVSFHFWEEQGDDKSNASVKKWSQPSGDDLKFIITKTQLRNIIDDRQDRHLVNVASLSVVQLRDELRNMGLDCKGKKAELVSRLEQTLGRGVKVRAKARSRLQVNFQFHDCDDDKDNRPTLDVDGLQELWIEFDDLMEALRALPQTEKYMESNEFHLKAKAWASKFRKLTFDEDVTPYIHTMVYHVPYFLKRFGFIHDIGVSQVERKNYDHRQAYFGSTNRSGGKVKKKVSLQILQRENRMLYIAREKLLREKRSYKKVSHVIPYSQWIDRISN
ncbi:uncharacterized protein LOC128547783 [Mercenaria mercenaria]|uniref:uncharacterized protein LOC128547783 n=1 Tax=Mercenaria mercenaria TaxID=6596 RepID=UPI00234EF21C|nr:uncharacterized protein LOC128547783 [Mercenaria mercenaria]